MEYLSVFVVLAGALVAVRGETWNKSGITRWGYLTIAIAIAGFVTAIYLTYDNDIESTKKDSLLVSLNENSQKAANKIQKLETELKEYHTKVEHYQMKLEAYQTIVGEIKSYSERQEQVVMVQAVNIPPGGNWTAPNRVFAGSKIETFFVNGNKLTLNYMGTTQPLDRGQDNWAKSFIIGNNGQEFEWVVHNPSMESFRGKIIVLSTPRSRSNDWSWLEEKLLNASNTE